MDISWLAVIIAAIAKFAIGFAWYSPALFGKRWQELVNVDEATMKSNMPMGIAVGFVGDLIMAYILARFILRWGDGLLTGAYVGFLAWLGFVATFMLAQKFYENRSNELFSINAGYQLVGIVVMGAIIGLL